MKNAIEISGLAVRFGRREVLSGLDLKVPVGSVTALLGRNGAGKTTLLRTLVGEIPHARGSLAVLGLDPRRRPMDTRRSIGWVPGELEVPRWMRVSDLLRFLAPFYPTWDPREEARLTELFGLERSARVADLSRGQAALLRLTTSLAHHPEVLLLDEPFAGLDVHARRTVFTGVLEHLGAQGRTVLVASHSLVDVERCADRVAFLDSGRLRRVSELDSLRDEAGRFAVTLRPDTAGWRPRAEEPARFDVRVESHSPTDCTLFALSGAEALHASLALDPRVERCERLPWDLEELVAHELERAEVAA